MISKVLNFITTKETLKSELMIYCKDKSIPLDDRWECFIKSDLGDIASWTSDCKVVETILENDECSFEKHSTNYYASIIERDYYTEAYDLDENWKNKIKEYALTTFEKGFIHDW